MRDSKLIRFAAFLTAYFLVTFRDRFIVPKPHFTL